MKKKEKSYIIIFDKHKNFKEICMLSESNDPFVVNPKSVGDSIYIYTQKEFAKLIESAIRYLTEPVGEANDSHANENDMFANIANIEKEVILPYGKNYLKYYKVPTGACSDSSSAMPTETANTDATKAIKKAPEEYRYDGNFGCIKNLGSNTEILVNGPALKFGVDLTDVASEKKSQKKK